MARKRAAFFTDSPFSARIAAHVRSRKEYFRVPDIHAVQEQLTRRGVVCKGAPHLIYRHPDGTEESMTFFEDPGGGLLSLMSQVAPAR